VGPTPEAYRPSWPLVLASRAVLVGYAVWLAWLAAQRRTRALAGVLTALVVIPAALALTRPPLKPRVISTFYAVRVPPQNTLRYRVTLSDTFVAGLRALERHAGAVKFVTPVIYPPFQIRVSDGGGRLLAESRDGRVLQSGIGEVPAIIDALDASRRIELEVTSSPSPPGNAEGPAVFGWQRHGLPSRELTDGSTGSAWNAPLLPAFEIRLQDAAGRTILVGF
jgi:hypothetical protein